MIHFFKRIKWKTEVIAASVFPCPFPHSSSPPDTRPPDGVFLPENFEYSKKVFIFSFCEKTLSLENENKL